MEETENTLRTDAPANAELIESKQLSPSQRKLAEVNAHFARTDMSKLFELIKDVRAREEAKLQS